MWFVAFLVLGPSLAVKATSGPVGWWMLDEKTGTAAADSSGNKNNGTLNGGATWTAGKIGGAVQGNGVDGYVSLPIGSIISKLTSTTVAIWANYSQQGGAWQRLFDFGSNTTVYMFLTPAQGGSNTGNMRFAITTASNGAESQLNAPSQLATGWHHVAVAIDGSTKAMQMYLDGAVVASATTATLPNALGNTTQNWLGRSQWPDAYYQGALDDLRIYDRVLSPSELQQVMKGGGYGAAGSPLPADGATDVARDVALSWTAGTFAVTHDVYLGKSFADVNSASEAKPAGVLVSQGQTETTYTPAALLDYGQTYYWRVDEVNAPPDNTVFKGSVWSFTVEPYSYPIAGTSITATASSSQANMGPENTINGSGLTGDQHGTDGGTMWMSKGVPPNWIQYQFDAVYKLDKLLVWNSNQMIESFIGFGAKDVTVEYSVDGTNWTALANVPQFAQGTGLSTYTANTTVNFGGVMVQYVKLTINENWSGALPSTGLAEVRFYSSPCRPALRNRRPAPRA